MSAASAGRASAVVVPLRRDRLATIGGSDIAAAAGIDPHRSRVMLWLEKTGRYTRPETEAMRWGSLLEPVIVAELAERGYEPEPAPDHGIEDPERPYLAGHPDGYVTLEHAHSLLEVKTANGWAHRAADGVPLQYIAQVQLYLHLTGLERALLATLVAGQRLELHEIARDDLAIVALLACAERMHWYIVTDTQPPIGPTDSDRDALAILHPQAVAARKVRLDRDGMRLVEQLRARKAQAAAIAEQVSGLENDLRARLGDAELAVSPHDTEVVRWSNVTTHRIDTTLLREQAPHLAEQYATVTTTRRFQIL